MTVRWKFKDLSTGTEATLAINPNQGGSPGVDKSVNAVHVLAPNRRAIVWEGTAKPSNMEFSGVIITQAHLEMLELWAVKRTLVQITDDLGRIYQGVIAAFHPTRERRAFNYWYHTYQMTFMPTAMKNASGTVVYGEIVASV